MALRDIFQIFPKGLGCFCNMWYPFHRIFIIAYEILGFLHEKLLRQVPALYFRENLDVFHEVLSRII